MGVSIPKTPLSECLVLEIRKPQGQALGFVSCSAASLPFAIKSRLVQICRTVCPVLTILGDQTEHEEHELLVFDGHMVLLPCRACVCIKASTCRIIHFSKWVYLISAGIN
jgi:hypothetical protein